MKTTKILTVLLIVALVLSLAACSKPQANGGDMTTEGNMATEGSAANAIDDLLAMEAATAEEAAALHTKLMDAETAILTENSALWEKVFLSADKGSAMIEDGSNYGDFLLKTIESAKDEFTADELKLLQEGGETIRSIEAKITALEEKFPGCGQMPSDDGMSVPADDTMTTKPNEGDMQKFPAFEGKDLDGNTVKSDELFSGNAGTVVNFWFTTCGPCVGELAELDALGKELAEKGGALIGVNSFTLDGDETAIAEAKDVLEKKGATYQNVYFASDSEAGKFTANIFAYPTTYVVDRNGNIVGEPIVGAITEKNQAETLQKLIDQALAADKG